MYPEDRRYTREHEWVLKLEEGKYRMGITAYAQEALGEVVFVELPSPGEEFSPGESMGVVESVKAVSDVYSPLTGRVEEVNHRLEEEPGLVNADPYQEGWLADLAGEGFENLLDPNQYSALVGEG